MLVTHVGWCKCPCWAVSIAHIAHPVTPYYYKSWRVFEDHSSARQKSYIWIFSVDNIFHFCNLGYFYSPSVMHFHRIGSVIICPTANTLYFWAKCMYLSLWSCGLEWYLPLSAVLGGFCVVLQKGVVSPRLYTLRSKSSSASLPADKPLWNSREGGDIRLK